MTPEREAQLRRSLNAAVERLNDGLASDADTRGLLAALDAARLRTERGDALLLEASDRIRLAAQVGRWKQNTEYFVRIAVHLAGEPIPPSEDPAR